MLNVFNTNKVNLIKRATICKVTNRLLIKKVVVLGAVDLQKQQNPILKMK